MKKIVTLILLVGIRAASGQSRPAMPVMPPTTVRPAVPTQPAQPTQPIPATQPTAPIAAQPAQPVAPLMPFTATNALSLPTSTLSNSPLVPNQFAFTTSRPLMTLSGSEALTQTATALVTLQSGIEQTLPSLLQLTEERGVGAGFPQQELLENRLRSQGAIGQLGTNSFVMNRETLRDLRILARQMQETLPLLHALNGTVNQQNQQNQLNQQNQQGGALGSVAPAATTFTNLFTLITNQSQLMPTGR